MLPQVAARSGATKPAFEFSRGIVKPEGTLQLQGQISNKKGWAFFPRTPGQLAQLVTASHFPLPLRVE